MLHKKDKLVFNTMSMEYLPKSACAELEQVVYQVELPEGCEKFNGAVYHTSSILEKIRDEVGELCMKAKDSGETTNAFLHRSTSHILQRIFSNSEVMNTAICYTDALDDGCDIPVFGYAAEGDRDQSRMFISVINDEKNNFVRYTIGYLDGPSLDHFLNYRRKSWVFKLKQCLNMFLLRLKTGHKMEAICNDDRCVIPMSYASTIGDTSPRWDPDVVLGYCVARNLDTEDPEVKVTIVAEPLDDEDRA